MRVVDGVGGGQEPARSTSCAEPPLLWGSAVLWVPAGVVAGLVYAGVLALGRWQAWPSGPTLGVAAAVLVLTVATAGPVLERRRSIRAGSAGGPTDLLGVLGPALARGAEAASGLAHLAEDLRVSVGARAVTIAPSTGGSPVVAGTPDGPATTIELSTRRRVVGRLTVHGDTHVLRRSVEPLEAALSGVVGVAVLLGELNADLAALRSRSELTRREEQQLLHRELDSTLAPIVEGVVACLERAHAEAADDPEAARRLVAAARDDLARGTAGVRTLARALLPAALDRGDLAGALLELTSAAGGAAWEVRDDGGNHLDPRVQLAFYLVAADLVGAVESGAAGLGTGPGSRLAARLEVLADDERTALHLAVSAGGGSSASAEAIRAAVEGRARSLGLEISTRPDGSVGVEVPPW